MTKVKHIKDIFKSHKGRTHVGVIYATVVLIATLMIIDVSTRSTSEATSFKNEIFIGNLSAGGERYSFTTVVFKKEAPENIVKEVHARFEQLYSEERVLTVGSREIPVKMVKVSRLVKDRHGRYMFRVADTSDAVSRLLSPYSGFIEAVITRPVPSLLRKDPDQTVNGRLIGPTNAMVRDLIGVSQVESTYGITGRGVNVAIIDTGVGYGHPDLTTALRYWSGSRKGEPIREPLVLDTDQQQVLLL